MPQTALHNRQRVEAVVTHARTLDASMRLLEEAIRNEQPKDVIRKLARRVQESSDHISGTLGPISKYLKTLLD